MTQIPPGWYPDPAAQSPPGRQRYWDGARWTEHLHDPQPPAPPVYPQYLPYVQAPAQPPTTPDGVLLAGWGQRAGAYLIDAAIQAVLMGIAFIPLVLVNLDRIREFGDRIETWSRQDEPGGFPSDAYATLVPLVLEIAVVGMVLGAVYTLAFWRWKQATPGKLALGLRIRRRDSPDFPWSAMLLRYGFYVALGLAGLIPFVGYATGILRILDYLWPLWDDKRQALHDKVAGTNVVSVRTPTTVTSPVDGTTAPGLPPAW